VKCPRCIHSHDEEFTCEDDCLLCIFALEAKLITEEEKTSGTVPDHSEAAP
jgi:hypothetical protein